LSKFSSRTEKQVKYWTYAAGSLPFTALALIFFSWFIGYDTLIDKLLVVIATTFFATSVFWWWWALNKLLFLVKALESAAESLGFVRKDIQSVRKDLNKSNGSNRKRRKQD
jgi:hypothetical protein